MPDDRDPGPKGLPLRATFRIKMGLPRETLEMLSPAGEAREREGVRERWLLDRVCEGVRERRVQALRPVARSTSSP